jgi:hypothetical protein
VYVAIIGGTNTASPPLPPAFAIPINKAANYYLNLEIKKLHIDLETKWKKLNARKKALKILHVKTLK